MAALSLRRVHLQPKRRLVHDIEKTRVFGFVLPTNKDSHSRATSVATLLFSTPTGVKSQAAHR
jgi:hypothetical protein